MANSLLMCLQGIIVVVIIFLDWIFVLIDTTTCTTIPCRHVSQRELATELFIQLSSY